VTNDESGIEHTMTHANLRLTWYGDDFSGSTDVMEALTLAGLRAVLFLSPPQPEALSDRFAGLHAAGVAGTSRAMTPEQMEAELRPKFAALKALGAPLCHYKTCSTFDSSPEIGSIGRAIDIGAEIFASRPTPLIVGAPALRRYLVFGNLFATVGAETFRLDRHPTMSKHPVTPMDEGDLRLHLNKQTDKSIGLLDVLHLAGSLEAVEANWSQLKKSDPDIILFDTLDQSHLGKVGRLIWEHRPDGPGFVAGSSGLEYALTAYWREAGLLPEAKPFLSAGRVDQTIIMSGSASPVTAGQIDWSSRNGFALIRLDSTRLIDREVVQAEIDRAIREALKALGAAQSVVLYTANGPNDPALATTRERAKALTLSAEEGGRRIGRAQGMIMRELLLETGIRRACIAGGDTSSYAAPQLGIVALEMIVPTAPGSPLCRASAQEPALEGLEIALKGGQVGKEDYFGVIRDGGIPV
jgi:uncharacterized protein YgbK (DUF1537 family)